MQSDLKNGTDLTGVGSVLKAMGAHGLDSGNSKAVGDYMGSLPLGLARMVQGGGEQYGGHGTQGAKDILGGAAQASTMPGSFAAPEADSAAELAGRAGSTLASKVPILNA